MTETRTILLQRIDATATSCRSCGARIRWAVTAAGKRIPLNDDAKSQLSTARRALPDGVFLEVANDHVHFVTCPNAKAHRRERTTHPSERID